MKLNEIVSARYGCTFPAKYNKPAIAYYREHIWQNCREAWPSCMFIFDMMDSLNDYTVHTTELEHMCAEPVGVWPALFESFLYAAYQDIKENGRKPKNLILILDNDR